MPHLSFETFVSQYFWLVLFLLILYYLISTHYIPLISDTLKARKLLEAVNIKTTQKSLSQGNIRNLLKDIVTKKYTVTAPKPKTPLSKLYKKSFSSLFSSK